MTPDVRRHSDGSIDFDFYRNRAAMLRNQARREAATRWIAPMDVRVIAGALGFAIVIPSAIGASRD